ncbi:MAG: hypothetical protein KDE27_25150 [Planctomycetes bacterium]|nr:hypothetical protein [Planctomycetota bacterium]
MRQLHFTLAAAVAVAPLAFAQADWTQLSPALSPSGRAGAIGVSDGARILVFGGKPSSTGEANDLWSFDGTNWTDITPTSGPLPPARDWYGAAWDTMRSRLVLFGGRSTALAADLGDTWEYDGTTWTQMTPANSPSPRRWTAMTYDLARGETVLFGGATGTTYYDDTWTWNGTNWTPLAPATSPSIRGRGVLSYDLRRSETIYYGGRDAGGALGETWKWDGSTWTQIVTANAPGSGGVPGLFAFAMTYDFVRDRHVIFGGTRTGGTLAGTWEFDGVDWLQRSPATVPASRTVPVLTFVLGLGKSYLFGGFQNTQLSDTWAYETAQLPLAAPYGAGCAGSAGVVTLTPDNEPWLGDTFTATATNLAPAGLAFEVLGLSDTAWSGGALPLPLIAIHPAAGAGCNLLASTDAVVFLVNVGGSAATTFSTPNDPTFAGIRFYEQILQLELGGTAITSISASNGVAITLGAR